MPTASVHPRLLVRVLVAVLSLCAFGSAQATKPVEQDSYADFDRNHVPWPSPETVLNDLRSTNDEARLNALKLAGLTGQQAHEPIWSSGQDSPAKIIGEAVITPGRTELTYAALGADASQQAILAFEVRSLQSTYAAVAVQKGKRWERVAATNCWCKYDMRPGQDMLHELVSLRPAAEPPDLDPQHYELVHSSGGGTGVYTQTETHFRMRQNELRNVISFVSTYRNGYPTVSLERRWFMFTPAPDGSLRGVLVEATGTFPFDKTPEIQWTVRPLLDMRLQKISCRAYRWDERTFRYEKSNEAIAACQIPAK